MNERIRELWAQCVIKHTKTPMNWQDVADEFAELILQAASDHIMESSDRYRKEYFADKVLKTFDGDGEYEIGTMEGLKEFEEKRNGNGS
jgi:hypothetical protein